VCLKSAQVSKKCGPKMRPAPIFFALLTQLPLRRGATIGATMKFHTFLPALALCLASGLFAQAQQQQQAPPEFAELQAASRIADLNERIKELQRLKAAYPDSPYAPAFNNGLMAAYTNLADTLDKVLSVQKEAIADTKPVNRLNLVTAAVQLIMRHPKVDSFPKDELLKAIRDYQAQGIELLNDPEVLKHIPEEDRAETIESVKSFFEIPIAKIQLKSGDTLAALATLQAYFKSQGASAEYYSLLGDAYLGINPEKDALEAYFGAAVEGDKDATEKAKALFTKINGDASKFDEELTRRQSALPFHPPAFVAPADWNGRTVLAELFTGSECPPCVGADLAFDGFIESYPSKYLAILEYHLPIPGPDPMMNPATKKRQDYYGTSVIGGTPTRVIDGRNHTSSGGYRQHAKGLFNDIKKNIDSAMNEAPGLTIKATAKLEGDKVIVDATFSKVVKNAEYNVVLVQSEEKHKGGNGIALHKMVVRDIATVKPAAKTTATFNIVESEKAADAYLTEYEKTMQARRPGFTWPARRNKIDRSNLKVVVFVQDKETKQVHNAFVADVAKK
jgi:predicted negative regulator of RcsB-dependent stress response/thiol-disulfide isomerase/thioredoxin